MTKSEPQDVDHDAVLAAPFAGAVWGRNRMLGRGGFYAPWEKGADTTTRQAEVLTTAVVAPPTAHEGLAIGRDRLSYSLVAHDPFTAYKQKRIESPAVMVIGAIGSGKSSLLKTVYVQRPLMLRKRRVVVIDKKPRGDEGEYAELTRMWGTEPIRFTTRGDGTILNPLDPAITDDPDNTDAMNGSEVLRSLVEIVAGRALTDWEDQALRAAFIRTKQLADKGRTPTLTDLVPHLGDSQAMSKAASNNAGARDRYVESGVTVGFILDRLLGAYPGLFDGETSREVSLSEKLTTFDVSQLPDTGPSVDAVIGLANAWLMGRLRRDSGYVTNLVLEEAWHIMMSPNAGWVRSNTKLARAKGLSQVMAIHNPSDIPPGTPGEAMLKEAQTIHVYRQTSPDDLDRVCALYKFNRESRAILTTLAQGEHLLRIGKGREIYVEHLRSPLEEQVTETDKAMFAGAE